MGILFIYTFILSLTTIYSYSLIDPNLTLIQTEWWKIFRDKIVEFGYYHRDLSWIVYLIIIIFLFIFHYIFIKKYKQFNPLRIAIVISTILLFSYPFLSHDFFNYMFDARIATFYHQNPYVYKALDFPSDPWLRFMQWTHRTYPYGPSFLILTLIPSFLSLGKFILSFIFFKALFGFFYLVTVYYLQKSDKKLALLFATHPLIIIEGLASSHNDLIGLSLGLIGIWYISQRKDKIGRIILILSAGIKYITFPLLLWQRSHLKWNKILLICFLGILMYLSFVREIQPWYFLNIFIFLPLYHHLINRLNIFFFGLLISYYPYIRLGGWDNIEKVNLKHWVIIIFFGLNIFYLVYKYKIDGKNPKLP